MKHSKWPRLGSNLVPAPRHDLCRELGAAAVALTWLSVEFVGLPAAALSLQASRGASKCRKFGLFVMAITPLKGNGTYATNIDKEGTSPIK